MVWAEARGSVMKAVEIYPQTEQLTEAELAHLLGDEHASADQEAGRELAAQRLAQQIDAQAERYLSLAGKLRAVLGASRARRHVAWEYQPRPAEVNRAA
jgi:hypothetical protein